MSNSSLATINIPATHYSKGRSGRKIEMITIHHMAGVLSAKQCGSIFQGNRQASSHYGIGNGGEIAQYVDEANTAWANGHWDSNCKAVTIETSNSSTGGGWAVGDKALNSLIKLVADIAKRNNLGKLVKGKNVTWHRMYCATTCPGEYLLSKMDYIVEQANAINNSSTNGNNRYKVGTTYTTQVILKVRSGAGTNKSQVPYEKLTANAKANAYSSGVNKGCLKEKTRVTCYETKSIGNDIWIRIPSGWVAGYYQGKTYVK